MQQLNSKQHQRHPTSLAPRYDLQAHVASFSQEGRSCVYICIVVRLLTVPLNRDDLSANLARCPCLGPGSRSDSDGALSMGSSKLYTEPDSLQSRFRRHEVWRLVNHRRLLLDPKFRLPRPRLKAFFFQYVVQTFSFGLCSQARIPLFSPAEDPDCIAAEPYALRSGGDCSSAVVRADLAMFLCRC